MLFRAIYIRDGKPRGITFAYDSAEGAAHFAERWVQNLRRYYRDAQLLTVMFKRGKQHSVPAAQEFLL